MEVLLKRLNIKDLLMLGLMMTAMGVSACRKRDRLSASTYTLEVIPPAAAVVLNSTQAFTARGVSGGGTIEASPVWTISPAGIGTLNTSLGPTVIFTAQKFGDVTI